MANSCKLLIGTIMKSRT